MVAQQLPPFNRDEHDALLAKGYTYTHHEADWYDDGDCESGPHLAGGPAYDEYHNETERVVFDETGTLAWREKIDPEFEAWIAAQQYAA